MACSIIDHPPPLTDLKFNGLKDKLLSLDPIGFFLWASGILPFLAGLNYGGNVSFSSDLW